MMKVTEGTQHLADLTRLSERSTGYVYSDYPSDAADAASPHPSSSASSLRRRVILKLAAMNTHSRDENDFVIIECDEDLLATSVKKTPDVHHHGNSASDDDGDDDDTPVVISDNGESIRDLVDKNDSCQVNMTEGQSSCDENEVYLTGSMHSKWYIDRYLTAMKVIQGPFSLRHGSQGSVKVARTGQNNDSTSRLVKAFSSKRRLSESLHLPLNKPLRTARPSSTARANSHPAMSGSPGVMGLPNGRGSPPSGGGYSPVHNGIPEDVLSPSAKPEDMMLLHKLEEANRQLERDRKSLQSLSPSIARHKSPRSNGVLGHSRTGSMSSVISNTSVSSNYSNLQLDEDNASPEDLWNLWGKITNDWENIIKKKLSYIKELVRKGIPHHFRGIVWQLLCKAPNSPARAKYAEFLKMTSPCEKTIRRDITRTYPEHDFFREKNGLGQESLFNVMKAYSLHDREVGYCQGSAFIVGLLLMQMPEEEAFAVLVHIMQELNMRELFKPSMAELGLCIFQLESMIQDMLPELFTHFQTQGFSVSMFASSWFLTLFATSLPLPLVCKVFDIFLSEGLEMVFRVGFAILYLSQENLLASDMEAMLKILQKDMPARFEQDPDLLFTTAYQVKYNPKKMKKLEKEYNTLKSKENEEQIELGRLRTENRLLIQRIDNLEKETATLADRLIQDQVRYAQQEEQVYALRREVHRTNTDNLNRSHSAPASSQQATEASAEVTSDVQSVDVSATLARAKDDQIDLLQQELAELRRKECDASATVTQLRHKIKELENANSQLQTEPTSQVQCLQQELIASKLREAECNLALKELQNKVIELDKHFQKYVEQAKQSPPSGKASKQKLEQLQEEVMSLRIREASSLADTKEMKQAMMELETQKHIVDRQLKRMEGDLERLQEQLDDASQREKDLKQTLKERDREISDLQSKRKEDTMMSRIKDAEHSQSVAEMRRRIAELEIENQELVTSGQLQDKGDQQELENKIADLQEEIMQLKIGRHIPSVGMNNVSIDSESDYDTEDMEATLNNSKLLLTDSMTGDSLASLAPPSRRPLVPGLHLTSDSSDEDDDTTFRIKTPHRKKRSSQTKTKDKIDLDKTPTQDFAHEFSPAEVDEPLSSNHLPSSTNDCDSIEQTADCVDQSAASLEQTVNGDVDADASPHVAVR